MYGRQNGRRQIVRSRGLLTWQCWIVSHPAALGCGNWQDCDHADNAGLSSLQVSDLDRSTGLLITGDKAGPRSKPKAISWVLTHK